MTVKCVDAPPRPAPRTLCCLKLLTITLITVDHSYDYEVCYTDSVLSIAKLRF